MVTRVRARERFSFRYAEPRASWFFGAHLTPAPYSAERRARRLLRKHLTKAQDKELVVRRRIKVRGSHSGDVYIIDCSTETANIWRERDQRRYCIQLNEWSDCWEIPRSDHLLAQKLLIETNERKFLRIANRI